MENVRMIILQQACRIKNRVVDTFGKSLSEMRNNSVPIFDSFRTPELNTFRS